MDANFTPLRGIPEPSLRRLPSYCQLLKRIACEESELISCTRIGQELNLDPTQVRKDIAFTGIVGKPKIGYNIRELHDAIETFLGWKNVRDTFLVGAGNLGSALLGYRPFEQYGVRIVAAFDVDPCKIGTTVHGKEVFGIEKLPDLASRLHIRLGILTTPAEVAQQVTEVMVASGIRGIWNFAPVGLNVPADVIVQSENLFSSLSVLSSRLTASLRTTPIQE